MSASQIINDDAIKMYDDFFSRLTFGYIPSPMHKQHTTLRIVLNVSKMYIVAEVIPFFHTPSLSNYITTTHHPQL